MPALPFLLLGALILIWGVNWPVLKIGVAHLPPLWLAAERMILGGLLLTAVVRALGALKLPPRQDWPLLVSVGLLQVAGFNACMNVGLLWVEAGRSAILAYTMPVWVAPAAVLLLREPLGRLGAIGMALGLAGILLLFNPLSFPWDDGRAVLGNGLLLLAALLWAIAIVHVRRHRWAASPLELAPWQMLVAMPPLVALAWLVEGPPPLTYDATALWVLAYNAGPATAFGIWAVVTVTRQLPAVVSSLSFLGVPVAGLLFSAWWLDEALTWEKLLGLGLVLGGVAAASLRGRERPA